MSGAGLGLQAAEPNTPEHTYFVKSLVLGGTICMIVMFGCYGMVSNLLCVNLIVSSDGRSEIGSAYFSVSLSVHVIHTASFGGRVPATASLPAPNP